MNSEIENQLFLRDQLIAGLRKEITLQDKIIREQRDTIHTLEEQLTKFQNLMKKMLES